MSSGCNPNQRQGQAIGAGPDPLNSQGLLSVRCVDPVIGVEVLLASLVIADERGDALFQRRSVRCGRSGNVRGGLSRGGAEFLGEVGYRRHKVLSC